MVGPLVLLTVVTWVGTLATPALAGASPLILMLLSPRTPVMVLAAATNPMWLFVALGTFRLAIADPFNFMIGRLWGHQAKVWSSERSKVARWVWGGTERAMGRAGLLVVALHPAGSVMIVAGATGMSWVAAAAADLVGTALYLVLMKLAAPWMAGPFQHISKLLGHYCLITSLTIAAGVGVWALVAWRSHRRVCARIRGDRRRAGRGAPRRGGRRPCRGARAGRRLTSASAPDIGDVTLCSDVNRNGLSPVDTVMKNLSSTTVKASHSPLRRIPRRRAGLAACVFALALLGAACSSGSSPKVSTGGDSTNAARRTTTNTTATKSGGSGGVGF